MHPVPDDATVILERLNLVLPDPLLFETPKEALDDTVANCFLLLSARLSRAGSRTQTQRLL